MKRIFWATLGAGFGFGMSFWTMRALRRAAERFLPAPVLERVQRQLDALDGGTGGRRASDAGGDEEPWRSGGTPHPSVGLRALADARRSAGR